MRKIILYSILSAVVLFSACSSGTNEAIPNPTGSFSGQFVYIHLNSTTGKRDTAKANITLSMSNTTGYAVTGDTSTLQAGSKGTYLINSQAIQFIDATIPATTTVVSSKIRLNGTYLYNYDGTNFQVYASTDTSGYTYLLKKN